jgi:acetate kinase
MRILVLNGGSSTFKCWYGDVRDPVPVEAQPPRWDARVDWSRHPGIADIRIRTTAGTTDRQIPIQSPDAVLDPVLTALGEPVDAVGHRVVHGGKTYRETTVITPDVRTAIAQQAEFAPSHNRLELDAIQAVDRVFGPGMPQVAVFDTAFHVSLEPAAYVYPGPYEWLEKGVRRYGFHGISHQYAARRCAHILGRDLKTLRIVTCHLGNGASLAAIRDGRSIETTMGFTPLEGLMMGTRSGTIDPGIMIYLVRHDGYTAGQLDRILNQESGLRGLSGLSGDMREILDAIAQGNERAQLAFDVYAHRLCLGIGSMLAALGGLDVLVFTAGVGENCAPLRGRVAKQFEFLGLKLDTAKNDASPVDVDVAAAESKVRVLVIRAEEDWEIARECHRVLSGKGVDSRAT